MTGHRQLGGVYVPPCRLPPPRLTAIRGPASKECGRPDSPMLVSGAIPWASFLTMVTTESAAHTDVGEGA
ncbi:hypothetical protein [Streptomyces sp. NPDC088801]|uniref:hypothetical protein n=1 Tax=Streptomyces sp. NPDC088801 TaxID=3365903 RepID=UPI003827A18C